ncbi:MAG: imidazolonepropionase [Actinomycetota bacterium]
MASAGIGAIVAGTVVSPAGTAPRRGDQLEVVETYAPGAVAWAGEELTYVGPPGGLPADLPVERFERSTVVPGFVDCHTHVPFIGWRADEFELRLSGSSYREQHREGGIARSARMFAEAPDDEILAFSLELLQEMAANGTTTVEMKTGYGLSVEAELRAARLARRLGEQAPQTCVVTLLACHTVPAGFTREEWVRVACDELIPAAAAEGLMDAVDIYVEDIAFTVRDLEAVAEAAHRAHLPLRCHADQLGASGASQAAIALDARSIDHCNHIDRAGIDALGSSEAVAVVLPGSTFLLRATPPLVSGMLDAGAAVAIATDCNPGTAPIASMPEIISFACVLYGLSPHAALTACTVNAAHVLGLGGRVGALRPGFRADLVVLDGEGFREVPYRPGHDPVLATYIGGARVAG